MLPLFWGDSLFCVGNIREQEGAERCAAINQEASAVVSRRVFSLFLAFILICPQSSGGGKPRCSSGLIGRVSGGSLGSILRSEVRISRIPFEFLNRNTPILLLF